MSPVSAPGPRETPTTPPARRGRSGFRRALAGALLLAGTLLLGAWWLFHATVHVPTPGRPEAAPVSRRIALAATAVSHPAERGRGGQWTPLAPGSELSEDEEVRTGAGGGAELSAGDRARVTISERTQLSVRELREDLHRYGLARGRVLVDYAGDGERTVRIEGEKGASAEARGARFAVSSDGLAFAVATETGRVDLAAAGASVAVEAGRQAAARGGGPPSEPLPIPKEVLLRLSPAGPGAGARCLEAAGRADPGALVTVDGMPVPVDGDGRFRVRVDRAGGAPVEIVAALPDGRSVSRQIPCAKRDEGRVRDIEVRWRRDP